MRESTVFRAFEPVVPWASPARGATTRRKVHHADRGCQEAGLRRALLVPGIAARRLRTLLVMGRQVFAKLTRSQARPTSAGSLGGRVSEPLFSIVVPTFNRSALVTHTIRSVLAQTCGDWEILVCTTVFLPSVLLSSRRRAS